ncbi:sulfatase-like hydrolase/transferase [Planctomycetota bacterium]
MNANKLLVTLAIVVSSGLLHADSRHPNILLILADDLGYGDIGCYNAESKIPTPNVDRLADAGMRFTDAHSPATVCSPTRYSILTGRMAFRTGMKGVFVGARGPCLIEESRLTLPGMLGENGYSTALVGKWHIGMTFMDTKGNRITDGGMKGVEQIDYSRSIPDGPIHRGFGSFFGTACCPGTDPLYAYIDGDKIPVPPTKKLNHDDLPNHHYSKDCRAGWLAEGFDLERIDMVFLEKSKAFLADHAKANPDRPFFLMHSTHAAHLPSFPAGEFKGKTAAGPHGDFIFMLDHIVGELMNSLDEHGFAENTIVIFTSDNGPEVPTVLDMRKTYSHDGARPWRGVKRDNWEGGHRVPLIVRWPGKTPTRTTTDQTTCTTDLMATCAAIVNEELPDDAGEDSFNMLPVILGKASKPIRPFTLHQTISLALAIREGDWKYLDHKGSGGNNYGRDGYWGMKPYAQADSQPEAPGQLYDLSNDPAETTNLFFQYPKIVKRLKSKLEQFKDEGRSAPLR